MKKINSLARSTIAFGLENDPSSVHNCQIDGEEPQQRFLAKQLGDELLSMYGGISFLNAIRACFMKFFDKQQVGEWLWNKPVAIAVPVVHLLIIPKAEKQDILQAFDEDLNLETCFASGRFSYSSLSKVHTKAIEYVKTIMQNFYSEIICGSGVPEFVLETGSEFNHDDILKSYLRTNPHLKVCPGCDGAPPSISNQEIHEDLDHFFPKSKYPFLSIHPLNLTPYCKHCNQTYKRSKDVMETPGVTSLADIYHPFLHPAQEEIQIIVRRDLEHSQVRLCLSPKANDPKIAVRLRSLNYLLDLEARWQGELNDGRLNVHLESALRYVTEDERDIGFQPDLDWIRKKLSNIAADMKFAIGRIPDSAPTQAYADWACNDSESCADWLQIYLSEINLPRKGPHLLIKSEQELRKKKELIEIPLQPSTLVMEE